MNEILNAIANVAIILLIPVSLSIPMFIKDIRKKKEQERIRKTLEEQKLQEENYRRLVALNINLTTKF